MPTRPPPEQREPISIPPEVVVSSLQLAVQHLLDAYARREAEKARKAVDPPKQAS